ncbi:MAG: 2Fe-2S iron-sulfur cluster binding domain-containing protein [Bacteriovoracaceae bacterium]|nr:2Fe-2S iron-sulfur cluster binding domain-containing protein [Bacteriovoracaceae bacterium]
MRSLIRVRGLASGKIVGEYEVTDPGEFLMFFLMQQGLPIASSCAGDGVCKKCVVNGDRLSCQIRVGDWLRDFPDQDVEVGYL